MEFSVIIVKIFLVLAICSLTTVAHQNDLETRIENKQRNAEPCDWFIDQLQKRRLNRGVTVPELFADVTEEPMEYNNFNYSDPLEFSADHPSLPESSSGDNLKGTDTEEPSSMMGKGGGCGLPAAVTTSTTSTTKMTTTSSTTTTTEEPCIEKRITSEEKQAEERAKNSSQRLSLEGLARKWRAQGSKKEKQHKGRVERAIKKKNKKLSSKHRFKDCFKAKEENEEQTTERVLLEANIHVGDGFQELLLDMLSPGDKTIKIAEENDEKDNQSKIKWQVQED